MAFIASPDWPNIGEMLGNPMGMEDFVFQIEVLLFFYLNYYLLIDKFYFTQKYLIYTFILIGLFVLFVPVTGFLVHHFHPRPFHPHHFPSKFAGPHKKSFWLGFLINRKFYLFLLTLAFSLFLRIWQRLKQIERDKLSTELNLLKAQINPHFLFNTLNSIYSLSLSKSAATSDAIIKLSSMMRYVLKDSEQKFVFLRDEINYLGSYIDLQKLRLNSTIKFEYLMEGDAGDARIAPLVLIPFIENAFKYGVSTEEDSEIKIHIHYEKHTLELNVYNTCVKTIQGHPSSTELGLKNATKRLLLLYPSKHSLTIDQTDQDFKVHLILHLSD